MHRRQHSFVLGLVLLLSVASASAQDLSRYFDQLGDQLRAYQNGESWDKYLALPKELLRDEATDGASEPTSKLLRRFDKLRNDPTYAKVTALPAFGPAYAALKLASAQKDTSTRPSPATREQVGVGDRAAPRSTSPAPTREPGELLKPRDVRRKDLSLYFDQLGDELRAYQNGESWAKYLALPTELLSGQTTKSVSKPTTRLLKRFDKLSSDPTYAKVTALLAFKPAYEALKLAVDPMDTSPPPSAATQQQPVAAGETDRSARLSVDDSAEPPAPDPAPPSIPLGERILESVVELDRKLAKVAPGSEWPKRLSLDELRAVVSVSSEQPASDSERKSVEDILATYQTIAKNKEDAVVSELSEFKETLRALQEYLTQRDVQPPKVRQDPESSGQASEVK